MSSQEEVYARSKLINAIEGLIGVHMGWDWEKSYTWMNTPNPNFGGAIPRTLVMEGRSHKVLAFVESAITENLP